MAKKPHVLKRVSLITEGYKGKCLFCGIEIKEQSAGSAPCPARENESDSTASSENPQ